MKRMIWVTDGCVLTSTYNYMGFTSLVFQNKVGFFVWVCSDGAMNE